MSFCAICTGEAGPFVKRPLGKDNGLVSVCASCDEEAPRHITGPERGYEPYESMTQEEMSRKLSAFATYTARPTASRDTARLRTPGFILVRVRSGRGIDARAAAKSLSTQPWYPELRYLGTASGWYLFERPDPKVAAASRARSENPLAAIEIYRVDGAA